MRVAKLLSVAAIAALTTAGPALAYGPAADALTISNSSRVSAQATAETEKAPVQLAFAIVKKTAAGGYVLVRNDNGGNRPIRDCDTSSTCLNVPTTVLISTNGTSTLLVPCDYVGGCKIVGKR